MTSRQAMCLAVICIAVYFLTGCALFGRTQTESGLVSGVVAGQPVIVKWTRDTTGQTTVEIPPAVISAATSAVTGDWAGLVVKGVAALSLVAAAVNGTRAKAATVRADAATQRAEEHKADAAEGWAEAMKP